MDGGEEETDSELGGRSHLWSVLIAGLVPLVIATCGALALRPVDGSIGVRSGDEAGAGVPLLGTAWGRDHSFLAAVNRSSYTLVLSPPGTESFPYVVQIFSPPHLDEDGPSIGQEIEAENNRRASSVRPAPEHYETDRSYIAMRGTLVEIITFSKPQQGPGTGTSFRRAQWAEGVGVATAYDRELRPLDEMVAMIEGLRVVSRAEFETQMRPDPRRGLTDASMPRLVGPMGLITFWSTTLVHQESGFSMYIPTDGSAAEIVDQAGAEAAATRTTVRGRPAVFVPHQHSSPPGGRLLWAEGDAIVGVEAEGPADRTFIDQIRVVDERAWRRLALGGIDW